MKGGNLGRSGVLEELKGQFCPCVFLPCRPLLAVLPLVRCVVPAFAGQFYCHGYTSVTMVLLGHNKKGGSCAKGSPPSGPAQPTPVFLKHGGEAPSVPKVRLPLVQLTASAGGPNAPVASSKLTFAELK